MIIGIGSDICLISRIEKLLDKYGTHFENRVFTEKEQEKANISSIHKSATYAKRFAAKEAFAKAIGTGIANGLSLKDIEVDNSKSGQPFINLTEEANKKLLEFMPKGHSPKVFLTLTDDKPYAMAFVIIEAVKNSNLENEND